MDVIFCRNVLMYFAKERAQQAGQRFHQALTEGGCLMVAATEVSEESFPQFIAVRFPGAFVYRRESRPSSAAGTWPYPAPAASLPAQPPLPAPAPPPARLPATTPSTAAQTARVERSDPALDVRHLANQGKLQEALAACVRAIAENKLDPALHYLHAIILSEENLDGEAKAALKRTLYIDPDFLVAHFALGKLALRQGNAPAARKSFNNALALLSGFAQNDILPEAEGLTAGRLSEIVRATLQTGALSL
jgi:chemotaxis protein methyltransferase CheR